MTSRRRIALACAVLVLLAGGALLLRRKPPAGRERIAAEFSGGTLTIGELEEGLQRLPPAMRREFDNLAGRRELAQSLVDKKLLALEARRRHLEARPDIRRQVDELEDRLVVQALLADEEKAQPPVGDADLARAYEAHKAELGQPERVRVDRVLAAVAAGAPPAARARARQRAEEFARRLRRGEPIAKVALAGDGPERKAGGELGWLARTDPLDAEAAKALFALRRPGEVTSPVAIHDGYAVFVLLERQSARTPALAEVRGEMQGREDASRRRRAFDELVSRLRKDAHPELRVEEGR